MQAKSRHMSTVFLGEFFRQVRSNREWHQADLAKILEVDQSYISLVEGNRYKKPPLEIVKKLYNKVLTKEEKETLLMVLYQEMDHYIQGE
jgi:transcriptional regulator with XRE-family HTH domain